MGMPWVFVTDLCFIKEILLSKTAPFPRLKAGTDSLLPVRTEGLWLVDDDFLFR